MKGAKLGNESSVRGRLDVQWVATSPGRIEAGISNRGNIFLLEPVTSFCIGDDFSPRHTLRENVSVKACDSILRVICR